MQPALKIAAYRLAIWGQAAADVALLLAAAELRPDVGRSP
jgi:hypothetical protein